MGTFTYEDIGSGQVKITDVEMVRKLDLIILEISEPSPREMLKSYLVKNMEPRCLVDPKH